MRILVAGDFVPNNRVAKQIDKNNYNCLSEVKQTIQSADFSIVNFESPVVMHDAKPIDKTGPNLYCTEKAIECVADAGFQCITLANNHFRDYGQVGVDDTIDSCLKYNLKYVGGGKTRQEAGRVLYQIVDGNTLAIINVCENEWSIAGENYGGSNPLNPIENSYTIQESKKQADYVLVVVHGGIEGFQYPTPRMQETYRFFVDSGADAVVNHHQHCYSGYEVYHGKPIFYGLGNFCFDINDSKNLLWTTGFVVMLDFVGRQVYYDVFPHIQGSADSAVVPMSGKTKQEFDDKIRQINSVISCKKDLQNQFEQLVTQSMSYRMQDLEPFNSKYIRMLQRKHLFPHFIHREQKKSMLMRMQCESNRDLLIGILKKYFKI